MINPNANVTVLPKKTGIQNTFFYPCSCHICETREQVYAYQNASREEFVNKVETVLLNTPLAHKNIDLSISAKNSVHSINPSDYLQLLTKLIPEQRYFLIYLRLTIRNITKFNQRYRHQLICKLNDHNLHFLEQILPILQSPDVEDNDLLVHEKLLQSVHVHDQILHEIVRAELFTDILIQDWSAKLSKAATHVKRSSVQVLQDHYSLSIASVPEISINDNSIINITSQS